MASFLASPLAGVAAVVSAYVASIFVVGGSFATFGLVLALYVYYYLVGWHKKTNVRVDPLQPKFNNRINLLIL
jgi:hypothetical protein